MPNTLEQILGSQPNWRQQFADTSNQIIQDAKNVSLADYDRATGTYVPRSQRTNAPTFTQRDLTGAQTQPAQKQQDTTQPLSYADMFVRMNPYRPQTAEEKEAERKRNRRNAVFAAIGDGISALSNLYFTTKGAPNAYTGGSTLSGKMYERQEQLRKERQALDQQYLNAYMNALRMDEQRDQQERNWKMQLENLALQQAAAKRNAELHTYKLAEAESNAQTAGIKAKYEEPYQQSRIGASDALTGQRNASAAASYARARNYDNGGSGSKSGSTKYEDKRFGGELFRLPVGYLKDDSNVSELFSMLPDHVRYEALGQWNNYKGMYDPKKKANKLSTSEKLDVIRANMTEEIKEELRRNSDTNYVEKASANDAPWVSGNQTSNKAPWVNN